MKIKLVTLLACLVFVGLGVSSVHAQASQDRETPCGMLALKDATSLDAEGRGGQVRSPNRLRGRGMSDIAGPSGALSTSGPAPPIEFAIVSGLKK